MIKPNHTYLGRSALYSIHTLLTFYKYNSILFSNNDSMQTYKNITLKNGLVWCSTMLYIMYIQTCFFKQLKKKDNK